MLMIKQIVLGCHVGWMDRTETLSVYRKIIVMVTDTIKPSCVRQKLLT